jgi:hypothetical protein
MVARAWAATGVLMLSGSTHPSSPMEMGDVMFHGSEETRARDEMELAHGSYIVRVSVPGPKRATLCCMVLDSGSDR